MGDIGKDTRIIWLEDTVKQSLAASENQWYSMLEISENREMILNFLDKPEKTRLIFYVKENSIVPMVTFSEVIRSKCIVILKRRKEIVEFNSMNELLFSEELAADVLEHLKLLLSQVYLPILNEPKNQKHLPHVVRQDVLHNTHRFSGFLSFFLGQTKGEAILPIPQLGVSERALEDRNELNTLESVVIDWTHEIQDVINTSLENTIEKLEAKGNFPGPQFEIKFWRGRYSTLKAMSKQLSQDRVERIIKILDKSHSSYTPGLRNVVKKLNNALEEAEDIYRHLKPLRPYLDNINKADTCKEVIKQYKPILHIISLIWKNSRHYSSSIRIVILLRGICNDIIKRTYHFIDLNSIWDIETYESITNLKEALEMCNSFKKQFNIYKNKINSYKNESDIKLWNFDTYNIFKRLNGMVERIEAVLDICIKTQEFYKLEKTEIGGGRGEEMTNIVYRVFEEFNESLDLIHKLEYDIFEPENAQFDVDYGKFIRDISRFDQQLSYVLATAFQDCASSFDAFKLLEAFTSQKSRNFIRREIEQKFSEMLKMYSKELQSISIIFFQQKQDPPTLSGLPKVSSTIYWVRGLLGRIDWPLKNIQMLRAEEVLSKNDIDAIVKQFNVLKSKIDEFQQTMYQDWVSQIKENSLSKLEEPLLKELQSGFITVNFHQDLSVCIQEVKYLRLFELSIPEEAMNIFENREQFRQYKEHLQLVVGQYNTIQRTLMKIERPLVNEKLSSIETLISKAIHEMNWNSKGIYEYIEDTRDKVRDLYNRLNFVKGNIKNIEKTVASWKSLHKIISVKEDAKQKDETSKLVEMITFWRFEEGNLNPSQQLFSIWGKKKATKIRSPKDIEEQAKQIHQTLTVSAEKFEVNNSSIIWMDYVRFVNNIVEKGIFNATKGAFMYLIDALEIVNTWDGETQPELGKEGQHFPEMLRIELELIGNDAVYSPDIHTVEGSFQKIVKTWIQGIKNISDKIHRLDNPENTFYSNIKNSKDISNLERHIRSLLRKTVSKLERLRKGYLKFSFLWQDDEQEYLDNFVTPVPTEADGQHSIDMSMASESEFESNKKQLLVEPTLEDFEDEIKKFEDIYEKCKQLTGKIILGWLHVDATPIKHSLCTLSRQWRQIFLDYLYNRLNQRLNDLNEFIQRMQSGLQQEVPENDYQKLVELMSYLLEIQEWPDVSSDSYIDPMKNEVSTLQSFGMNVDSNVIHSIEEAPQKWKSLLKTVYSTKDRLAPLQNAEIKKIRKFEESFNQRSENYRDEFLQEAPFDFSNSCKEAYQKMDQLNITILEYEKEFKTLVEKQKLFQLIVNHGRNIRSCRSDLKKLKSVWDVISLVEYQIEDWKQIPFSKINTDEIGDQASKFLELIKNLDKRVKTWNVFTGIETKVKNFKSFLPLVKDLRHPGMKERHWKELMRITGVEFDLGEQFTFDKLLNLNLQEHSEEVSLIVTSASKALGIEKSLDEIQLNWNQFEFKFYSSEDSELELVKVPEDALEELEDDQMTLQNHSVSRYSGFFSDTINEWMQILHDMSCVLDIFLEVQKTWAYLANIFISSEDIKEQLEEDTKRFQIIDKDIRQLLEKAKNESNIKKFCITPDLLSKLKLLKDELAICSKSLDQYLETKRLAFPRFYFVSSSILLDILSKGGKSARSVMVHISKLFQAIDTLEFQEGSSDVAIAMRSFEGERVEFSNPVHCTGQVEDWLNKIEDEMKITVNDVLKKAVSNYDDLPREKWLEPFAAQVVLSAAQLWWTTEVNKAFEDMEEGNENAMKEYNKKQIEQLNNLIKMVQGNLSKGQRQKVMNLVTIDVHARDVVSKLIQNRVESPQHFTWQSQLRLRWNNENQKCIINICDAEFVYGNEYLGNQQRLVITPLTDRIYVTLTQSLHLKMGGAPAGPAGTGKTETTKDLGAQLGKPVYVFNCSDQMETKSLGNIFKGLASSGSWVCFDEFNRIAVEVLSVVSTQYKSILNAMREEREHFQFQGEELRLDITNGVFITMNPGYLGRTELPESLKALFRPVTVVVPDLELICENMLMAEGFVEARYLAKKFITLYRLNKDLLSQQDHYDWGLRSIKSVLVVAGSLKRAESDVPEEYLLMRALRDFNLPKIVPADLEVFYGLLEDIFPDVDPPRKIDDSFEDTVQKVITENGLQAEENLILKIVQLRELLTVRHSVFIIGPPGSGKSVCWKMLQQAETKYSKKVIVRDLNPKAVSSNELYGYMNESTKEWKQGLLSSKMQELAYMKGDNPKWITLDGDLDTEWIESMNSVMDDNKVLTLANNERIPLTDSMRLLFEISHLRFATPATVSRAGIIYMSQDDIGWLPFIQSWIDKRKSQTERSAMLIFVDKYVSKCLEKLHTDFKMTIPLPDINLVQTLCWLLESLLEQADSSSVNETKITEKEFFEILFVFSCVWAFGGVLGVQDGKDQKEKFDKWWRNKWQAVKFPSGGTVFDFKIDFENRRLVPWKIPKFEPKPDIPISKMIVPTIETARMEYFMDSLVDRKKPVMLVGSAGCGKTQLIESKLNRLSEQYISQAINCNYYTDSPAMQKLLEQKLDSRLAKRFAPKGNKQLIYFVDDINMPYVDNYGTQTPNALIRQHMDYGHWYDRQDLTPQEVVNVQYVAAMNPTAGSFTINPRLQRQFATFSVDMPTKQSLSTVYSSIFNAHKSNLRNDVASLAENLISSSLELHEKISSNFQKSALKFHYEFNLRHLSNLFEGLLRASSKSVDSANTMIKLWLHESRRVYSDRLVSHEDISKFEDIIQSTFRSYFSDQEEDILIEPILFSGFGNSQGEVDGDYHLIQSYDKLEKILFDALKRYNDSPRPTMNLVLFKEAMEHVCRISRIIEMPRGNALLVGVGGSGKQSLSRLAAFLCDYQVFQVSISRNFGISNFKDSLKELYRTAGLKAHGIVFLFTDTQIVDERFLVYINDILSSGNIPDLFATDEKETILEDIKTAAKAAGIIETRENLWSFFIDRVKDNLHVILCFSPVGDALRVRCRKFPALINCTAIDWFFPWPRSALQNVAKGLLKDKQLCSSDSLLEKVVEFIAFCHESVTNIAREYAKKEKRHSYTTPKSFLEMIKLFSSMYVSKKKKLQENIDRLRLGISRLDETTEQVSELRKNLKEQEAEVEEKKKAADELFAKVNQDKKVVEGENRKAAVEEEKSAKIAEDVEQKTEQCEVELKKQEPLERQAAEALDTLKPKHMTELKSFRYPPHDVENVMAAVIILLKGQRKVPKDRSWSVALKLMGRVDHFMHRLKNYDKTNIPQHVLDALQEYLNSPKFNGKDIEQISFAAAGLCEWVRNVVAYYEIYCKVQPLREALERSKAEQESANHKLKKMRKHMSRLKQKLSKLEKELEDANMEKMRVVEQAQKTQQQLDLAQRLVDALASEKIRWGESVNNLQQNEQNLVGDVLLSAAFISYCGSFNMKFRDKLVKEKWLPFLQEKEIPLTEDADPLRILVDDVQIAEWSNQGLPTDAISVQNGAIAQCCERWPLIIDPQLQGIQWLKSNQADQDLIVLRNGQKKMMETLERAIENGNSVIIEDIGETIDPMLFPIIARNISVKHNSKFIKLGDNEIEYNDNFKLILHTKLANPHYIPEVQAETTLINFSVTEKGLEDQLLAIVINKEYPDLEEKKSKLLHQQNEFKIRLKSLEDDLLEMLFSAEQETILSNEDLINSLEQTKQTALEIQEQVKASKETEIDINETRDVFRPAAGRGALLYFLLCDLVKIEHMYQYSLSSFKTVFRRALELRETPEDTQEHLNQMIDSITFSVFRYVQRGLFERHKLIFATNVCLSVLERQGKLPKDELGFLLNPFQRPENMEEKPDSVSNWMSEESWIGICSLTRIESFTKLKPDIEGYSKRWKEWAMHESPEKEKLPQEWKNKTEFQKLLVLKCLRPDRLTQAMTLFVSHQLGQKYIEHPPFDMAQTFSEADQSSPFLFILFPGANPATDVEALGKKFGFTSENNKLISVSMGQGQQEAAENGLQKCYKEGGWVMLQNIHLMKGWLPRLERLLESYSTGAHLDFRVFLTAEPSSTKDKQLPQGILQNSIKIANEPPQSLKANLTSAFASFSEEFLDSSIRPSEFKTILFTLCFFHSLVLGRRRFGCQGWSRHYSFGSGDLEICANVLYNYLESTADSVPWEDLQYMFGEIMYGGHITDTWDRRTCSTYLELLLRDQLLDDMELAPGFSVPPVGNRKDYLTYIEDHLPAETPAMFGLHSNAEIGFLTSESKTLFRTILDLRGGSILSASQSKEEKVLEIIEDMSSQIPSNLDMEEIRGRVSLMRPYTSVVLQECERMNVLLTEVKNSLSELKMGLNGELTISEKMDEIMMALHSGKVPRTWEKVAYPSLKPLNQWIANLVERVKHLEEWVSDVDSLPKSVWISGLFNPMAFLTAVKQEAARKNKWPLDKVVLQTEVTKKTLKDVSGPPREGAYIHGLFLEGAGWNTKNNALRESHWKEMHPALPVMTVKAVKKEDRKLNNIYECPVYMTAQRGPTYIFTAHLRTVDPPSKWTLAGVALLMNVENI